MVAMSSTAEAVDQAFEQFSGKFSVQRFKAIGAGKDDRSEESIYIAALTRNLLMNAHASQQADHACLVLRDEVSTATS